MRATEDVPTEAAPILMTPEGFDAFLIALSTPACPVPEMVDVLSRTAPWEDDADEASLGDA